jgi:hypothetical protein
VLGRTRPTSVPSSEERNVTIGTANRIARALGTRLSSVFPELERSHEPRDGA